MGLVLENWRAVSVSNPYPTNPASGGPAQSSSYDNLILANYTMIPSLGGTRERERERESDEGISSVGL